MHKQMRPMNGIKTLIITLLLVVSGLSARLQAQDIYMNKGICNLTLNEDLRTSIITIEGEAEFYWDQLLTPAYFDTAKHLNPTYVAVPKSWNKCLDSKGEPFPTFGYGTYRLGLVVPRGLEPATYMIKVNTVFSAYRLWLGRLLMAEVGELGTAQELTRPDYRNVEIPFTIGAAQKPTVDTIYMVIQVANFHHVRSGLHEPIKIATQRNMLHADKQSQFYIVLVVGMCLLMVIVYFVQSMLYRTDISMFWLGILAVAMALRLVVTGDRVLTDLIPNMPWELLFKLDNISGFCTVALFALYFHTMYSRELPRSVYRVIVALGLIIVLAVALLPNRIYGQFKTFYEVYVGVSGLYLTLGVMLLAVIRKRPFAFPTFVAMFLLFGTAFYDVAASMDLVLVRNLASWGVLCFMAIQATVTTVRNVRVQKMVDGMSAKLQQQASELEMKVEQRVAELRKQQQELLAHQEREQVENWRNVGVARVNEVIVQYKDNYRNLCQHTLSSIVNYIDAKLGDIYLLRDNADGTQELEMVASYGVSKEQQEACRFIPTDHGLVGASFTRNRVQVVNDLPKGYAEIGSGLGNAQPDTLLLQPMEFDGRVLGVIELGVFGELPEKAKQMVEMAAGVIAANLNSAIMGERNVRLIQQFEAKTQEMRENEARMRSTIEDLEAIREQYERLKAHMESDSSSAYGD